MRVSTNFNFIRPSSGRATFTLVVRGETKAIRPFTCTTRFACCLKRLIRVGTNPAEEASGVDIGVLVRAGSATAGAGALSAKVKVVIGFGGTNGGSAGTGLGIWGGTVYVVAGRYPGYFGEWLAFIFGKVAVHSVHFIARTSSTRTVDGVGS